MQNIQLTEEEKKEQLEMLEKEGLRARIANLLGPACHVMELANMGIRVEKTSIVLVEKQIAIILFLSEEINKTKQP
jgi:hypothetical protein